MFYQKENIIYILDKNSISHVNVSLSIYNINGNCLLKKYFTDSVFLNTSAFSNGTYLVVFVNENHYISKLIQIYK